MLRLGVKILDISALDDILIREDREKLVQKRKYKHRTLIGLFLLNYGGNNKLLNRGHLHSVALLYTAQLCGGRQPYLKSSKILCKMAVK